LQICIILCNVMHNRQPLGQFYTVKNEDMSTKIFKIFGNSLRKFSHGLFPGIPDRKSLVALILVPIASLYTTAYITLHRNF